MPPLLRHRIAGSTPPEGRLGPLSPRSLSQRHGTAGPRTAPPSVASCLPGHGPASLGHGISTDYDGIHASDRTSLNSCRTFRHESPASWLMNTWPERVLASTRLGSEGWVARQLM